MVFYVKVLHYVFALILYIVVTRSSFEIHGIPKTTGYLAPSADPALTLALIAGHNQNRGKCSNCGP